MSVKIRLQRHGSKKRPFYFIVVANNTAPRDGRFIEKLGTYNPLSIPATVRINRERALYWLQQGAQPTNTCRRILSFKGVLYLKHLMRGVTLNLFDEKAAWEKFEQWNAGHEELVAKREETHRKSKQEKRHDIMKESVRKVEEKQAAKVAAEQPAEEPATEEPVQDAAETGAEATAPEAPAEATATSETPTEEPAAPEAPATDEAAQEQASE